MATKQIGGDDQCDVCRGGVRGQATFTSECAHTFHIICVKESATCPICAAPWKNTFPPALVIQPPPMRSYVVPPRPRSFFFPQPPPPPPSFSFPQSNPHAGTTAFNDDEPVEPPVEGRDTVPEAAGNGALVLTTHIEHPSVARDAAQEKFAVMVHAKGPVAAADSSARAPLDLVTVLDVSGSMAGSKLTLLKQAMGFVIDQLGPSDRLSVVTFSCTARRIIRLTRMSGDGKAAARAAMESLMDEGSTNIGDGLRVAAQVLDGRRHRNAVASIILLSDGQDNHTLSRGMGYSYVDLVPRSLRRGADNRSSPPVHTFGFGTDHDAAAMHAIAEVAGGTFSFIENQAAVQDSFAQCIGGLLSVAVQEARLKVECLDAGVRVRAVKSGCYESRVDADGRAASVDVGELYAEEERRFLLFVDVPVSAGAGRNGDAEKDVTRLIKVSCTYKDAATGQAVDVAGEDAVVERPVVVSADAEPSVEVARERFRVEATEDIAASQAAAERGAFAEAARILERRRWWRSCGRCARASRAGASDFGGGYGAMWKPLSSCGAAPPPSGPPMVFGFSTPGAPAPAQMPPCGMPRAPPSFGSAYATPAMQDMVESSRKRRQQQEPEGDGRSDPKQQQRI
ncbi:hypothetical protein QOZ80_1BG0090160 [Eleusine coracana subsp. coracana]|nr:hypothetical protein QOZ80_1BG0090160 [Eleusine coracana subsp. coracana]